MSIGKYKINRFFGIDQSVEENYLANGYTADACNMNTDDGNLSVAKGFTRKLVNALPGDEDIHRCVVFRHKNGTVSCAVLPKSEELECCVKPFDSVNLDCEIWSRLEVGFVECTIEYSFF